MPAVCRPLVPLYVTERVFGSPCVLRLMAVVSLHAAARRTRVSEVRELHGAYRVLATWLSVRLVSFGRGRQVKPFVWFAVRQTLVASAVVVVTWVGSPPVPLAVAQLGDVVAGRIVAYSLVRRFRRFVVVKRGGIRRRAVFTALERYALAGIARTVTVVVRAVLERQLKKRFVVSAFFVAVVS